jgi:hypothetical protein
VLNVAGIDDASEKRSAIFELVESLGEVFEIEFFTQGNDVVLRGEFQHFSDFLSRSDEGTSNLDVTEDQVRSREQSRSFIGRSTNATEGSHLLSETNVADEVITDREGVKDEVELAGFFLKSFRAGDNNTFSTQLLDEVFLALATSEGSYLAAPSLKVLNTHMSKTTDTEDGNIGAGLGKSGDGGIGSDTSAEKGRNSLFRKVIGDLEVEVTGLLEVSGITSPVFIVVGELVGKGLILAQLFEIHLAVVALTTAGSLTSKTSLVADLEVLYVSTNGSDNTGDFMTRGHGVGTGTPFFSDGV